MAIDWLARLFSHLKTWGFEVFNKPHTKAGPSPEVLEDILGVKSLHGNLEDIIHDYDIVIFDRPLSTCLYTTVASDRPLVFVDLEMVKWDQKAMALLRRRCAVVPASFDSSNRVQIDWNELRGALDKASNLMDRGFYETFLKF